MKLNKKQLKKRVTNKRDYDYEMVVTGIVLKTVISAFSKGLHSDYGFGKKRLDAIKQKVDFQLDCMAKEYVRYQDILDMVKEETGFNWF